MTEETKNDYVLTSENKDLIPATTPRVQRSMFVQSGEIFTLHSWETADGKTRLLFPMDASDEELEAGVAALAESDASLESMRKVSEALDERGKIVEDPEPQWDDQEETRASFEEAHFQWSKRQEEVIIAELVEDDE